MEAPGDPTSKARKKTLVDHYRPIRLALVLCKIGYSIVTYLHGNRLYHDALQGFQARRSCLTNSLTTMDNVTRLLDGEEVDMCFINFSRT